MKATFVLILVVAILAMAIAGVHHYKYPENGDSVYGIFDRAASIANGII